MKSNVNERFWIAVSGACVMASAYLLLAWAERGNVALVALGAGLLGANVAVTTWRVMRGYPQ